MAFLDTQNMHDQLLGDIDEATSLRDLHAIMELILPLHLLKNVLKERLGQFFQSDEKSKPTSAPPTRKTESSLRKVYFSVSSIERVFPEAIHVKIISYLQKHQFSDISLLSKTYNRWMTDYPVIYNQQNVRKLNRPLFFFFLFCVHFRAKTKHKKFAVSSNITQRPPLYFIYPRPSLR